MRRLAATAATLVALAISAATAAAADLKIVSVDDSRYPGAALTVSVPPGSDASPKFTVRENGQPISGVTVQTATEGIAIAQVIDASRSMSGAPILAAVEAASGFAASKHATDQMALFSFGPSVQTLLPLTSDGIPLASAIGQIGVGETAGTALYDGIIVASRALASVQGRRVMVVLTDGDDQGSQASEALARATARDAGVTVYGIALKGQGFDPAPLRRIAEATGGSIYTASKTADSIRTMYARIDKSARSTFRLEYTSSAASAPIRVSVALSGGGRDSQSYSPAGLPTAAAAAAAVVPAAAGGTAIPPVFLALGVGAAILIALLIALRPLPAAAVARRIEMYTTQKTLTPSAAAKSGEPLRKRLMLATERVFGHLKVWKHMAFVIEQADLPLRTAELAYLMGATGLLGLFIGVMVLGGGLFAVLTTAVGVLAPYLFVRRKAKKRCAAFEAQLADTLIAVASSLRAGHSFSQAVAAIVKEGAPPMSKEFTRVESETRLGRPSDEALQSMATRLGSKNFEFVVLAVNVQRQVGGSLAEILDMVGDTVRDREQFSRKVKALTSMGRASAWVLLVLPFMLAGVITLINRAYMRPLYFSDTGHKLIIFIFVSMLLGGLVIRKIVNFRY